MLRTVSVSGSDVAGEAAATAEAASLPPTESGDEKASEKDESSDEDDGPTFGKRKLLDTGGIDEDEEKRLESLVFGSESFLVANIEERRSDKKKKKSQAKVVKSEGLKFNESAVGEQRKPEIGTVAFEARKPVWQDEADIEMVNLNQYSQFKSTVKTKGDEASTSQIEDALKARFAKYYGTPVWADLDAKKKRKKSKKNKIAKIAHTGSDDEDEEDDDEPDSDVDNEENDDLFQQTGNFLADTNKRASGALPKNIIDIKPCTDANKEEPDQARLKCVEFHPSARVMLTAGLSQKLTLFQIDGKKNSKIQSIFIEKFPILAAHFTRQGGDEIIMGSRHKSFYYYDMHAGKVINVAPPTKALDESQRSSISTNFEISPDNRLIAFVGSQGQIHLFSVKSKEWIDSLKINDSCNCVTFSPDSRYLFAFGDAKDVYVFDMNDRGHRSLHRFTDFGCLSGTSIAVSNNSQFLATGCKSGVVNIYDLNASCLGGDRHPKPLKSFMNLTTPCTSLKFNSTSEILATCSAYAENACKLIHVGSLSVFANFPLRNMESPTQMRIPQCLDFSLNSGYLAIGNHKGNALLYRLKNYGSF